MRLEAVFKIKIRLCVSILLIILLTNSCQCAHQKCHLLPGKYVYKKMNVFEKWYLQFRYKGKFYYTPAIDLTLFSDSTYIYQSCGGTRKGKYKVINDSLILYLTEFKKPKIDSIQYFNPPIKDEVYYIINNNALINVSKGYYFSESGKKVHLNLGVYLLLSKPITHSSN